MTLITPVLLTSTTSSALRSSVHMRLVCLHVCCVLALSLDVVCRIVVKLKHD